MTPSRFLMIVLLGIACHLTADACLAEVPKVQRPPNVIVILTDDQGACDAGCYGAKDIETPAIDALAARGVRFTQFYSAAPVCSPSRAGVLTGRYPLRAGMPGNAPSQQGQPGMPPQATLASLFHAKGYATAHIGKWHLGFTPETMPCGQGFEHSFGHMGGCIDNYSHFFYWDGPNRHDLFRNDKEIQAPGRYFPEMMVEEAERFLEENQQKPFLLYFALNMPHYPYQGTTKWLERYRDLPSPRNLYAAFVSTPDEQIGRLLDKVDRLGLRDNTIIVFQSDNGHSTEVRAHHGGGSAGPYRGQKFSLFEGGIRLPAIISWPVALPQGAVRGQMVHACDWIATLAELSGIDLPKESIDGKSIVRVIESADAPSPHDVLHWQVGSGDSAQWAVRQGDWKLIGNVIEDASPSRLSADDKRLFLANLAEDVSEKENFASSHPEVVDRLFRLHSEWVKSVKPVTRDAGYRDAQGNER